MNPACVRWAARCASMVLAAMVPSPAFAEDAPRPRNVLFLLSDDQRPDTIAALGNPIIESPNLDRLARRGTAFTRAVSPNPLCVPSRAEILTGCSGFRNGVLPGFSNELDPSLVTWPEAMRRAGFSTATIGKWHTSGRPSRRGFDEAPALFASGGGRWPMTHPVDIHGRPVTGYTGWVFQSDDGRIKDPGRGVGLTPGISAAFADAAIEFLRREHDRPFFLQVSFTAPHDPLLAVQGLENRYDPTGIPLPPNVLPEHPFDHGNLRGRDEQLLPWPRTPEDIRADIAAYYAVITDLDAQVGRILGALDAAGLADETLVILTSDHGLAIGSHGLRGKQNMYEHTVGVPMILTGPGIPDGRTCDAPVYLRDLYPTACELVGVPVPDTVEATSFAAIARGADVPTHPLVFGYFTDTQRMARGDRWKLIEYPQAGRVQLFDLAADPFERDDRSDDPAAAPEIARLRDALHRWQQEAGDPLLGR